MTDYTPEPGWPAGWRPAPVGGPVHEPEWFTVERLDKTYIQCSCGREWPCPTRESDTE